MNNQQIVSQLETALRSLNKTMETKQLGFTFWDKSYGDYLYAGTGENSILFLGWEEDEQKWKIEYVVEDVTALYFLCDCLEECVSRVKMLAEMVVTY